MDVVTLKDSVADVAEVNQILRGAQVRPDLRVQNSELLLWRRRRRSRLNALHVGPSCGSAVDGTVKHRLTTSLTFEKSHSRT